MSKVKNEKKLGSLYSIGELATLMLEFFAAYALYYMTTVQVLNADMAALVISIGTIGGAIASIIVGYASDNSQAKGGRRRSYVIRFIFPTVIVFIAFFMPFNLTGAAQVAYLGIFGILFYVLYNLFLVPFDALGGEIVEDYNNRTFVRTLCTVFLYIGVVLSNTVSAYIRSALVSAGVGEKASWSIMVAILGGISLIAALFAWKVTAGSDKPVEAKVEKVNILAEYLQLLKIRAVRIMSLWVVVYCILSMTLSTMTLYFGIYVLGLSETLAATLFTVAVVVTIVTAPLVNVLSAKLGKKRCLNFTLLCYFLYVIYILIKGANGFVDGVIFGALTGWINGTALTISYSMFYDLNEVVAYRYGEQKPSEIMGLYKCSSAIGMAIATSLMGRLLVMSGFDGTAAVQSATTVNWLLNFVLLLPTIVIVITVLITTRYKINAKNHAAITKALEARAEGKEYPTDEFEEILK